MISFRVSRVYLRKGYTNKGLKQFYEKGTLKGIQSKHKDG